MITQEIIKDAGKRITDCGTNFANIAISARAVCNSLFEPFQDEIPISEIIANYGTEMILPREYLYGTQPANQYITPKRSRVERRLRKCGELCLQRTPPFVVALFDQDGATLAIVDGHNRIRYSAQEEFGIRNIPSLVLSIEEYAIIMNRVKPGANYNSASARNMLERDIDNTLVSFGKLLKGKPHPIRLPGVSDMEELQSKFFLLQKSA